MATGPHTCASHDGTAVSRCDASGAASAVTLASFTAPAVVEIRLAPAAFELAPLSLAPAAAVAPAPETPPPKV